MLCRTDPYAVDLHGMTAAEAVYVVRDIVASLDVSCAFYFLSISLPIAPANYCSIY